MGLDLAKVRKKQKELEIKSGNYFRCKDGRNTIRVFTFSHKVTKQDVAAGLFEADELGKVVVELYRPITRVFGTKGEPPHYILTPDDPVLTKYKELASSPVAKDRDVAERMKPKACFCINVVDTSQKDFKVVRYDAPKMVIQQITGFVLDEDYGEEILGPSGIDFVIDYDKKADISSMYQVRLRKASKCERLPASLEKETIDFYDNEVFGEKKEDDEVEDDEIETTEDDDVEEKPKAKRGRPRKPEAVPDAEDVPDEEDDETFGGDEEDDE